MAGLSGVGRCLQATRTDHGEQTLRRACASILVRSDLILAEMSHRIGFRLKAVARNAHAALRCNITISQNRGNASAREPRTYHGRGFSLLDARVSPAPSWSFSSMARR